MCFWKSLSGPSLESDTYMNDGLRKNHRKRNLDTYNVLVALRLKPFADTELHGKFEVSVLQSMGFPQDVPGSPLYRGDGAHWQRSHRPYRG